jgi:hypothetical protein
MQEKENRSTFLNEAIEQIYGVIRDAKSQEELREVLTYLITDKIKESFKNGLEVESRQKRQDRKPFRRFRR